MPNSRCFIVLRVALVGLLGWALPGCDDECAELAAARCAEDGRAVETCLPEAEGGDSLGWHREPCDPMTPTCVEQAPHDAVCVGERVGDCDFQAFEDRCVDEHTLEDCAPFRAGASDGVRHHMRCADGERCEEVPSHAIALGRPPNATHACHPPRPRTQPPALVTFVHGDVRLGDEPAPTVPFRVPGGTRLHLGEGARAIVLVKERPSRFEGPAEVDVYEHQPAEVVPSDAAQSIVDVLSSTPPPHVPDDEPLVSPAPSEPGVVRLFVGEGVPGASARLPRVEWRCETECGRTVQLRETGRTGRVLWRATGERRVDYDGPPLESGNRYELAVGERTYRVETRTPPNLSELLAAVREWPLPEQMSVVAAVHRWAGSRAAAVQALELTRLDHRQDADLGALLDAYR